MSDCDCYYNVRCLHQGGDGLGYICIECVREIRIDEFKRKQKIAERDWDNRIFWRDMRFIIKIFLLIAFLSYLLWLFP